MVRSATSRRETNLGVFAKLFEDCPKAETLCRSEIGGYDHVLDFLISDSTDVDLKLCNVNRTLGVVA
jgi:hypothetical protein